MTTKITLPFIHRREADGLLTRTDRTPRRAAALEICEICGATFETGNDHHNTAGIAICADCRIARIQFNAAAFVVYAMQQDDKPCHSCDNTGANDDGLCPTCQAWEEADAALYAPHYQAWEAEMRAGQRAEDMTNGGIEPEDCDEPCPHCDDQYEHGFNFDECPANPDNYDGPVPSENEPHGFNAFGIMVLAALLFLITTHTLPAGCAITGNTGEGFPLAECDNGTIMYQDLDGSTDRAPGTWVTMEVK